MPNIIMADPQGETVYKSSTGLLYTKKMVIDVTGEESTKGLPPDTVLKRYGSMPFLEDLTLTGIMRWYNNANGSLLASGSPFDASLFPKLSRLAIQPTEIRTMSGTDASSYTPYPTFAFAHYLFQNTNLKELILGKVGNIYYNGGGYYSNNTPDPPGPSATSTGSEVGLTLKIYVASYLAKGGFQGSLSPTTTVIEYDYLTGEEITQ